MLHKKLNPLLPPQVPKHLYDKLHEKLNEANWTILELKGKINRMAEIIDKQAKQINDLLPK